MGGARHISGDRNRGKQGVHANECIGHRFAGLCPSFIAFCLDLARESVKTDKGQSFLQCNHQHDTNRHGLGTCPFDAHSTTSAAVDRLWSFPV